MTLIHSTTKEVTPMMPLKVSECNSDHGLSNDRSIHFSDYTLNFIHNKHHLKKK